MVLYYGRQAAWAACLSLSLLLGESQTLAFSFLNTPSVSPSRRAPPATHSSLAPGMTHRSPSTALDPAVSSNAASGALEGLVRSLGQSAAEMGDRLFSRGGMPWTWGKQAEVTPESDERWRMAAGFRDLSITHGWCVTQEDETVLQLLSQDVKPHLSYLPPLQVDRVLHALKTAYHAHLGQHRRSGEPFVIHPVEVMKILADYRVDAETLMAGLLHDTVEDTRISMDDIVKVYGPTVGKLVEGETKVSKLPKRAGAFGHSDVQATNLCHLILAVCEDWRVLVIKLADRLHNMRTLNSMPEHKQMRTARETMEVFVPLAEILGVQSVKEELENLSFQILDRDGYETVKDMVTRRRLAMESSRFGKSNLSLQQALFEHIPKRIQAELGITAHVWLESKPLYEISRLANIKDPSELFKVTVVLGDGSKGGPSLHPVQATAACYHTQQVLTEVFSPGHMLKVRDYIEHPLDGYRGLHTMLDLGADMQFEVQVRSDSMERVARYGSVLALWSLHELEEEGTPAVITAGGRPPLELPFLQNLQAQTQAMVDNPERMSMRNLLKSLQAQLAMRRLVFTSEGEILSLELPAGRGEVTARDVAIAQAQGKKLSGREMVAVNGRPVPLSRPLHHGDRVQVIQRKRARVFDNNNTGVSNNANAVARAMSPPWTSLRESGSLSFWPLSLLGDDEGERQWLREAESRHGRMAIAFLLSGVSLSLLQQTALLTAGAGWEEWTFLDIVVPIVSLVGAVELAYAAERSASQNLNGFDDKDGGSRMNSRDSGSNFSSSGSGVRPLGQQLYSLGSSIGLSSIAGQVVTLLKAWEALERGSGRSAMLVCLVMLLQHVCQSLFLPLPLHNLM